MPVTIYPAPHGTNEARPGAYGAAQTSEDFLRKASPQNYDGKYKGMIQSSFPTKFGSEEYEIAPSTSGFVKAAVQAYNRHHHLIIRPEEVWFTILTQLAIYVNGHAEEVRSYFVAHDGKKQLIIEDKGKTGSRLSADMARMTKEMAELLKDNINDPLLYDWIMPNFTTTTDADLVTASALMMGALQQYFEYVYDCATCGIPAVTLLGERSDWENILNRLDKLSQLGSETTKFGELLKPILRRLVKTFDDPDGDVTTDFWQRIASSDAMGSGPTYLCGWITAFCFWDESGKALYTSDAPFGLQLDDVCYHIIDIEQIPAAYVSMPVMMLDNERPHIEYPWPTTLVAGVVGFRVSESGYPIGRPGPQSSRGSVPGTTVDTAGTTSSRIGWGRHSLKKLVNRLKLREKASKERKEIRAEEMGLYPPLQPGEKTGRDTLQPISGWWIFDNIEEKGNRCQEDLPEPSLRPNNKPVQSLSTLAGLDAESVPKEQSLDRELPKTVAIEATV